MQEAAEVLLTDVYQNGLASFLLGWSSPESLRCQCNGFYDNKHRCQNLSWSASLLRPQKTLQMKQDKRYESLKSAIMHNITFAHFSLSGCSCEGDGKFTLCWRGVLAIARTQSQKNDSSQWQGTCAAPDYPASEPLQASRDRLQFTALYGICLDHSATA